MPPVTNARFLIGGLAAWPLLMAIATIDGILREMKLVPWIGMKPALITSGIVMLAAVYVVAWLLLAWWGRPRSDGYLWLVGLSWVVLTIVFEVSIGVLAQGLTVGKALQGYHPGNLRDGNLILPGLVLMLVAPVLVRRLSWRIIERRRMR